ncbi:transglutaminase domain-containing protein [Leucobacter chromiireducens]|uniref:transglutaminase domain-containing protein n=1 Tax=Leucobacter chromiireducens TaxID=283877 RepID=UPI0019275885
MRLATLALTPWYRRPESRRGGGTDHPGSTLPTAILDHASPVIRALVAQARERAVAGDGTAGPASPLATVRAAHALIRDAVRPVTAMEETTPASRVLARGTGSCSQRLGVLESAARAIGVETRVRALSIDGAFWRPRFPRLTFALPDRVLLAWPEFRFDAWRSASELFGPLGCGAGGAFTNSGAETLFEAAGRCAVDWDGRTNGDPADLSTYLRADLGYVTDRDELFARFGQTLCFPSRVIADPVMRRIPA